MKSWSKFHNVSDSFEFFVGILTLKSPSLMKFLYWLWNKSNSCIFIFAFFPKKGEEVYQNFEFCRGCYGDMLCKVIGQHHNFL